MGSGQVTLGSRLLGSMLDHACPMHDTALNFRLMARFPLTLEVCKALLLQTQKKKALCMGGTEKVMEDLPRKCLRSSRSNTWQA